MKGERELRTEKSLSSIPKSNLRLRGVFAQREPLFTPALSLFAVSPNA
jgi:hypothetical protein